jgi:hypothetical protein
MDNKTLRRVVNYDHEASACQLWQTLGRCCRDGKPGNGIILTRARSGGEMFANRLCLRTSILSFHFHEEFLDFLVTVVS